MTAATVGQAQVMARYGVRRILIANEVLDRRAIRWLGEADADLYCLVDSVAGVEALDAAGREIKVLAEVGSPAAAAGRGRTTTRPRARRGRALPPRHPVGVECFEGVVEQPVPSTRCSSGWWRSSPRRTRAATPVGGRQHVSKSSPCSCAPVRGHPRSGCYVVTITARTRRARRSRTIRPTRAGSGPTTRPPRPAARSPASAAVTRVRCRPPHRAARDRPVSRSCRGGDCHRAQRRARVRRGTGCARATARLGIPHPCGAFDRW